jgi:hypothetical protein
LTTAGKNRAAARAMENFMVATNKKKKGLLGVVIEMGTSS